MPPSALDPSTPPSPSIIRRADPGFALFDKTLFVDEEDDTCGGPEWLYDAGTALLVLYMVTMAILLLNLLIAVLSTVHNTVHDHAELEFNLSRNQFIQRSAGIVDQGHLPPPLNLVGVACLVAVDFVGECGSLLLWLSRKCLRYLLHESTNRTSVWFFVLAAPLYAKPMLLLLNLTLRG